MASEEYNGGNANYVFFSEEIESLRKNVALFSTPQIYAKFVLKTLLTKVPQNAQTINNIRIQVHIN